VNKLLLAHRAGVFDPLLFRERDELGRRLSFEVLKFHFPHAVRSATFASRSLPEQDSNERAFNKLARTYTSQVQVLKLNRSSGEQTVTVQNVSVSEGSQAIVGNVTQQAPEKAANINRSAITDARTIPMPILDAQKPRIAPAWRRLES
jgi:hypothetical protein